MAITELYVDPSIAGASGAGTVGDPYGDLQHCLDTATFDTTNGTRINIKSGTAEILAASLDLATNFIVGGGMSATARLILQGYASAANDGSWTAQTGIGGIDCNNDDLFAVSNQNYITIRHLEIFGRAGAGYAYLVFIGDFCHITECELHTHSGTAQMCRVDAYSTVTRCHIHNCLSAEQVVYAGIASLVQYNYVDTTDDTDPTAAIVLTGGGIAYRNIIRVAGATDGILLTSTNASRAIGNSIWSNGGTGQGITVSVAMTSILNNVVEGFSGAGGVGIENTSGAILEYGGNHVYNCTTNYNVTVLVITDYGDNEDLSGSSPFTAAATENFTPVDVGNMKEGAFPPSIIAGDAGLTAAMKMWKGALEPAGGAGGGLLVHPGTSGGARG